MSTFSVIEKPSILAVSTSDLMEHMRIVGLQEYNIVESYAEAAIEYCEHKAGRAFITQTLEMRFDKWADSKGFVLMRSPVQSIEYIKYYDKDNNLITVDSSKYTLINSDSYSQARIILSYGESWTGDELAPGYPIIIRYVAGYGGLGDIPSRYRSAIKLLTAYYYENREGIVIVNGGAPATEIPFGINTLLTTGRGFSF